MKFDLIAFDADDTLWHEERKYKYGEERFVDLLSRYVDRDVARAALHSADVANLKYFGYGVKGFVLSMIDTAVKLTDGAIPGAEIAKIIQWGRELIDDPIECFPHVETTLANVARQYTVMMITKGDLFDQESKIARSGLAHYFDHIEVVSNKRPETYAALLEKYQVAPERFLMIGNALRSDIEPVVSLGGHAIYIPAALSWAHEDAHSADQNAYTTLDHIGQVLDYLAS